MNPSSKITNQITEGSICYMPVEVKQFRDAWKNIEGTATKDFIQKKGFPNQIVFLTAIKL